MFDKFRKGEAREPAAMPAATPDAPAAEETPSARFRDKIAAVVSGARDSVLEGTEAARDAASSLKDRVQAIEVDPKKHLVSFAAAAIKVVDEIDGELAGSRSAYEVANFNITGNASLLGGLTITINFSKTKAARDHQARVASLASGACPLCHAAWTLERAKLAGRERATLRCQACQDTFEIDANGVVLALPVNLPPAPTSG